MTLDFDLLLKNENEKIVEFARSYKFWQAFFKTVSERDPNNPNIQSLITNIKLLILTGYADRLGETQKNEPCVSSSKSNYDNFFQNLSLDEKFYFTLIFDLTKIDKEANKIYKEMIDTNNVALVDKLMEMDAKHNEEKDQERIRLLNAYLEEGDTIIEKEFKRRTGLLYGIRSKLVHSGSPVIGAMTGDIASYYGGKDDFFFSYDLDYEEFFFRAIYKIANLSVVPVKDEIRNFLFENRLRYAPLAMKVVNKLEKD